MDAYQAQRNWLLLYIASSGCNIVKKYIIMKTTGEKKQQSEDLLVTPNNFKGLLKG